MASKRSIPTTLFASPDFFELSSNTIRLILVGIILDADDEGRGRAHPRLLARKLDQQQDDIEQALVECEAHGILLCYEVAGRRYYWLRHWHIYQTLSKPTTSCYPAPPEQALQESEMSDPGESRNTQEMRGFPWPEGEGEEKQKGKEREGEEEASGRANPFPTPASSNDAFALALSSSQTKRPATTTQVASVLHLPESQELHEIMQEFLAVPTLSVLGEAIEARAWMDDPRRNTRQQHMTPAFFRRWLRRSQHGYGAGTSCRPQCNTTTPTAASVSEHEPDQYEVYVNALIAQYNGPEALQVVH